MTRLDHLEAVRLELHHAARGPGISSSRLVGTRLFTLVKRPRGWTDREVALALHGVLQQAIGELGDDKQRAAVEISINTVGAPGRLLEVRQQALAAERGVQPETVRRWWNNGAKSLARLVLNRIDELNDRGRWDEHRPGMHLPTHDGEAPPNHRFKYIESTWWFRGRVATELVSHRRLLALADGVDRYEAHASYFSDPRPETCTVSPLMNCELGNTRWTRRGMLLADLIFPEPLARGQEVSFAYRVTVHSDREAIPIFQHECRAAGVDELVFRLQLDPESPVSRVWRFAVRDDAHASDPPADPTRYLRPSRLGFVEQLFGPAQAGWKYGIALEWTDNDV